MSELFVWVEVEQCEHQTVESGSTVDVRDWSYDLRSVDDLYTDGDYHVIAVDFSDLVLPDNYQIVLEEDGLVKATILKTLQLSNIRGLEWEDFPDYGGWNASDKEPCKSRGDYHEWISYRSGSCLSE